MAKYSKALVARITELIRSDSYTIAEICQEVKISKDTYYRWLKENSDFSDAIKEAQEDFDKDILSECNKSLRKLITGYTVDETKTVYVEKVEKDKNGEPISKPKIKEQTVTKKHFQPSLGAIIHFQTNHDPETWQNKQNVDITTKGKELAPARILTKKEAQELFKDMSDEY